MSDVPISIVLASIEASERLGLPRSELLGAPSVEERHLAGKTRRIRGTCSASSSIDWNPPGPA